MAKGVQVWSQTAGNNATADTNINWAEGMAPSAVNDSARAVMASVASWRDDNNGTLVTAGTSAAFTLATNQVESALTAGYTVAAQFHITCDTSATLAVDGLAAKPLRVYPGVVLNGGELGGGSVHKFTYSTTGTGEWIRNSPPAFTVLTNSLGSNTTIGSTSVYVDGPSVTQGSSGVWFATGNVTINFAAGSAYYLVKLWDGTTVIDSCKASNFAASNAVNVALSGIISAPAGNIKISAVAQTGATAAYMASNDSGSAKDSTLTAVRIG